ncbi:RipA family octameric membrane protein [Streptomyces chartreusis]
MENPGNEDAAERRATDERIWQHGLHLDAMLFQRGNLFLLAQSLQVVAYSTVLSASTGHGNAAHNNLIAARVIAAFGIVLTLIWLYSAHRHYQYDRGLQRRLEQRLPEYSETRMTSRARGPSHMPLVVYVLPTLAGIMWLTLLSLT